MFTKSGLVAVVSALTTLTVGAQAPRPNPEYANWTTFPIGTAVTERWTTLDNTGKTSTVTETITLREIQPSKVVVEVEYISEPAGAPVFKTRPKSKDILNSLSAPKAGEKAVFDSGPPGTVEAGKEFEKVATPGGVFSARWYKTRVERNGARTDGKSWLSDDVPGRLVKAEEVTTSGGQESFRTLREVIEIKRP